MSEAATIRQRTVHFGLGPIGLATLRSVAARPQVLVSGGVDVREDLQGRDVGELAGIGRCGARVVRSLSEVGPRGFAEVVVHCAGSHVDRVAGQIIDALAWGASVVTTCEELAYPWFHHPGEARRIHEAALAAGRTVLATGINPGFAMDALAIHLTSVSDSVERVEVRRVVDAGTRRGPLQLKVGAGISPEQFEQRRAAGTIGHVGLVESVALIAAALGWRLSTIEETLDPVLSDAPVMSDVLTVEPGQVAGIRQVAVGRAGSTELIRLHLEMYVGAPDPRDETTIEGRPVISSTTQGLHGDVCTAAITANAVAALPRLRPGLITTIDLLPLRGLAT